MQSIVHIDNSSLHQSGNNGYKVYLSLKKEKKRALLDELKKYYYVISF